MGKSTNGPDATDVMVMMSAMEALHGCHVELTVTASTEGHNGTGRIDIRAVFELLPDSQMARTISTNTTWPNGHTRSWWGEVMQMLYVLDFMIGEVYQQRMIPMS